MYVIQCNSCVAEGNLDIHIYMAFLKQFISPYLKQTRTFSTKYTPRSVLLHRMRNEVVMKCRDTYEKLLSQPDISEAVWEEIKKDMLDKTYVTPLALDTFIISTCQTQNLMHAGIQYYKLIESSKKPSIVTTAEYLLLYGYKNGPLSDAEKEHVWKVYKEISEQYTVLSAEIANACITVLAKLGNVDECIKVIEQFEKYESVEFLRKGYDAFIMCLLEQEKIELMFKYMIISFKKCSGPTPKVYTKYLEYCLKDKQDFNARIERLLLLWREYGIIPHETSVKEFSVACNDHGWSAKATALYRSMCTRCKLKAFESDLTMEEFQILKESIMKKLIIEKGYQITNPREQANFIKFIESKKPYDVVIDALNVVYSRVAQTKYRYVDSLINVVQHVHSQNKRILVIGKSHMLKYKKLENLKNIADFYYVENISNDDEFTLFATVSSGQDTIFISNDFMRQHKFALNDSKVSMLFKRWQHFHQYTYIVNSLGVNLIPLSGSVMDRDHYINSGVQKTGSYWHIPFHNASSVTTLRVNPSTSRNWFCFRMPESQT
ncbi:mitochondrial ribonuclease P catalytic subunit isoform X2 [Lasioglossum baleicum]|uniref:mitochondrial ribonuclease P catalytic subunit isoform X2 n=1 Tax=Lasioglossum baleicum TaxID=434251 RepID=UPI003FCEBEB0